MSDQRRVTIQILALRKFAAIEPRLFEFLLHRFGSLDALFEAGADRLAALKDMTPQAAQRVHDSFDRLRQAAEYLEQIETRGIATVNRTEAHYPSGLLELNDPPLLLYLRGHLPQAGRNRVTLCGAASPHAEGVKVAAAVAKRFLSGGVDLLSTVRSGADASIHLSCRAAGEASWAILDTGFDDPRLSEMTPLMIDIMAAGGVLSEFAPDEVGAADSWRSANRLLAALTQAVVVTEVYHDSAPALDLLRCCSEIGKLAFVLIDSRSAPLFDEAGLSEAVRHGAIPMVGLEKIDDIVASLV